MEWHDREQI
jgi:hypothetical protein